MEWYIQVWKKYAVFSGRAHRTELWMFVLFNFLFSVGLAILEVFLGGMTSTDQGILSTIYSFAVLIPSLAVNARRMHDVNRSAWWMLVPIAGLIFALQKGTEGENRFGPPPKL